MKLWSTAILVMLLATSPCNAKVLRPTLHIQKMISAAEDMKTKGDVKGAYAAGLAAIAVAEKNAAKDPDTLYYALEKTSYMLPSGDMPAHYALYVKGVPVAVTVYGPDSYEAQAYLAGRQMIGLFLGKPDATLDSIATPLARAAPLAQNDKDRFDMASMTIMLGRFYDNAGKRDKAMETIAIGAKLYETPPRPLNNSYYGGLNTLAQIYTGWGQWDQALDTADRSINAIIALEGADSINIVSPLIQRSIVLQRFQRYGEALAALQRAQQVADVGVSGQLKASALLALGRFYAATGQDRLAVPTLTKAAAVAQPLAPGAEVRMIALVELYTIAIRNGDAVRAEGNALAARDDVERRTFKNSAKHAAILLALGNAQIELGKLAAARATLDQANAMLATASKPGDERRAEAALAGARLALRSNDLAGARSGIETSLAMLPKGATSPIQAEAEALLAQTLSRQGDRPAAWRAARRGADTVTTAILARAAQAGAPSAPGARDTMILSTALDSAWSSRSR